MKNLRFRRKSKKEKPSKVTQEFVVKLNILIVTFEWRIKIWG